MEITCDQDIQLNTGTPFPVFLPLFPLFHFFAVSAFHFMVPEYKLDFGVVLSAFLSINLSTSPSTLRKYPIGKSHGLNWQSWSSGMDTNQSLSLPLYPTHRQFNYPEELRWASDLSAQANICILWGSFFSFTAFLASCIAHSVSLSLLFPPLSLTIPSPCIFWALERVLVIFIFIHPCVSLGFIPWLFFHLKHLLLPVFPVLA